MFNAFRDIIRSTVQRIVEAKRRRQEAVDATFAAAQRPRPQVRSARRPDKLPKPLSDGSISTMRRYSKRYGKGLGEAELMAMADDRSAWKYGRRSQRAA